MQTMYRQRHELPRDPSTRAVINAAVNHQGKPKPPAVISADLALEMNRRWERQIREKVSEFARAARIARRESWPGKKKLDLTAERALGASNAYMAAARRLKGLL